MRQFDKFTELCWASIVQFWEAWRVVCHICHEFTNILMFTKYNLYNTEARPPSNCCSFIPTNLRSNRVGRCGGSLNNSSIRIDRGTINCQATPKFNFPMTPAQRMNDPKILASSCQLIDAFNLMAECCQGTICNDARMQCGNRLSPGPPHINHSYYKSFLIQFPIVNVYFKLINQW